MAEFNISESEGLEPLIKENVTETTEKFELPFKGFTKKTHPKVNNTRFTVIPKRKENENSDVVCCLFFSLPQEYEEALKKIRKAYFSNITNVDVIKRKNADLFSMDYEIIKIVALQANANHKATGKIGKKNTFLFR